MRDEDLNNIVERSIDPWIEKMKDPEGDCDWKNDKKSDDELVSKPSKAFSKKSSSFTHRSLLLKFFVKVSIDAFALL